MRQPIPGQFRALRRAGGRGRAFTLIELLVVISVISLLMGILIPALGTSREASRRIKCLANLRSIGMGVALYQNDHKGRLPYVLPLRDPPPGETGSDPTLLTTLEAYIDAPVPTREPDSPYYRSSDPYTCPSDRSSDDASSNFQPIWRQFGTSYEYAPGYIMVAAELRLGVRDPALAVTNAFDRDVDTDWPILTDGAPRHPLKAGPTKENALYYKDKRADWLKVPTETDLMELFAEIARTSGAGFPCILYISVALL